MLADDMQQSQRSLLLIETPTVLVSMCSAIPAQCKDTIALRPIVHHVASQKAPICNQLDLRRRSDPWDCGLQQL